MNKNYIVRKNFNYWVLIEQSIDDEQIITEKLIKKYIIKHDAIVELKKIKGGRKNEKIL